jgi:hypothetical protein
VGGAEPHLQAAAGVTGSRTAGHRSRPPHPPGTTPATPIEPLDQQRS